MSDSVKIQWLGHACFRMECGGHTLVIDPYKEVPGYPALNVSAGQAIKSHDHDDHGFLEAVQPVEEEGESPFAITQIDSFHDPENGALRGTNKITIIEAAGKRIAHMGDLGHMLNEEQIAAVGKCDVMLLPVGGYYTVDAAGAKQVANALDPVVIIPMHYRKGERGFDVIAEPDEFLALCSDRTVIRSDTSVFEPDESGERRVVLLEFGK